MGRFKHACHSYGYVDRSKNISKAEAYKMLRRQKSYHDVIKSEVSVLKWTTFATPKSWCNTLSEKVRLNEQYNYDPYYNYRNEITNSILKDKSMCWFYWGMEGYFIGTNNVLAQYCTEELCKLLNIESKWKYVLKQYNNQFSV